MLFAFSKTADPVVTTMRAVVSMLRRTRPYLQRFCSLALVALCGISACHKPPRLTPGQWVAYRAPDNAFSIQFPLHAPMVRVETQGPTRTTYYSVFDGITTYMVEVFENPRYVRADPSALLDGLPDAHAAGPDGHFVSRQSIRLAGHTGRATRIEGNLPRGHVTMLHRVFVVNGRIIGALVATAPGALLAGDADQFLDSFRLP
jgi:hypothetical protein